MTVQELFEAYRNAYKLNNGAPQPEGAQTARLYTETLVTLLSPETELLYFAAWLASEVNRQGALLLGPGTNTPSI